MQSVKEAIEGSDCLIISEPCFIENNPMVFPGGIPVKAQIYIRGFNVIVENEVYEGVTAVE